MRNFAWRAALAVMSATAFTAAPAHAELVNATDPEKIRSIVESLGSPATLRAEPNADPYIESNLDGMPFLVIFMNCTGGRDCRTLQYYMGFSDAKQVPLERFNEWNREKRFARAYRDESGDPVLEMDVDVDFNGLPRENIRETFNTWASLMRAYRDFILTD